MNLYRIKTTVCWKEYIDIIVKENSETAAKSFVQTSLQKCSTERKKLIDVQIVGIMVVDEEKQQEKGDNPK